jgi:anaerobic ribonucleoside-triphosphate reductase activating protein
VVHLARLHPRVTTLGPGSRLGVWFQGCRLACPGCMSRDTWDPAAGEPVTVAALSAIWTDALTAGADGLTVSGGEPLDQPAGLGALLADVARIRDAIRPEADLLVYTGYPTARARREQTAALRHADAVITGRYRADRPTQLVWRGSANQELVPLTPLGERRYREHLSRITDRPALQIVPGDDGTFSLVGVPRSGDLDALDGILQRLHLNVATTTWRG